MLAKFANVSLASRKGLLVAQSNLLLWGTCSTMYKRDSFAVQTSFLLSLSSLLLRYPTEHPLLLGARCVYLQMFAEKWGWMSNNNYPRACSTIIYYWVPDLSFSPSLPCLYLVSYVRYYGILLIFTGFRHLAKWDKIQLGLLALIFSLQCYESYPSRISKISSFFNLFSGIFCIRGLLENWEGGKNHEWNT